MSAQLAQLDNYALAVEAVLRHADRVEVAEHLYGFDERTAQRLAFYRWLRETGRLSDS